MCIALLMALSAFTGTPGPATQFVEYDAPPLFLLGPEQLARLQREHRESPAVRAALAPLMDQAAEALAREPDPIAKLVYEGRVSNDPERVRTVAHLQDMARLDALLWAHQITGEARYAQAARRTQMAWIAACPPTGNDVNDHKLVPLVHAFLIVGDALRPEQRQQAAEWIRLLSLRTHEGFAQRKSGNRPAKRLKMLALAAVALDDAAAMRQCVELYREHLEASLRPDGTSYDLEHRDAMSYHVSCLVPLTELALLAKRHGHALLDLQTPQGASLRKSIDFVVPYAKGERVYLQWRNTKVDLDRRRWDAGDPHYEPGSPWKPGESADLFALAALLDTQYRPVARQVTAMPDSDAGPVLRWLMEHE